MRDSVFSLWPGSRSRRSLSARGQFRSTFAGIGFCLALTLLAAGGYLIEQQFANPVEAQSAELLFSALLIATSVTLLSCLLHPSRKRWHRIAAWSPAIPPEREREVMVARSAAPASNIHRQSRYVDQALVRIRR